MSPTLITILALALGQFEPPATMLPPPAPQGSPISAFAQAAAQTGAQCAKDQADAKTDPSSPENEEKSPESAAAPERWFLMKCLQGTWPGTFLEKNRMQVSGWTDVSFTASSAEHSNLPMGFNYRANEFLLQQNWLRFERSVVTSDTTEPSFGFRSDWILPGSDYRFTLPRGIFNSQLTHSNGQPDLYGIDPIQFYAEAYFPNVFKGMDVKFGRMFCQYGVETFDAPSNALLSHAYTFMYDPATQTGLMATVKLTDTWSVQFGAILGSEVFINSADEPTGMGSIKWAPPEGKDTVLFSVILGSGRFNQSQNFNNPEIFDLVYTHKINSKLTYNFESLFGFTTNVPDTGNAYWFGILNYLTYDFCPKLTGTARVEFFDDNQGQRTGFPGLYSTITSGVSYKPFKWLIIRPEVRYDYNSESSPFEGKHGLFTAAADLILRW